MPDPPAGLDALLGGLRLRIVGCDATFELATGDGVLHPLTTEVRFPGATVGRGTDSDVRVVGPASTGVSRRHLLIEPRGPQWRMRDLSSRNGTWEPRDADEGWERVPAG